MEPELIEANELISSMGRTRVVNGYIRRYAPDHPWPRSNREILEHVRVMELHIGRRITNDECVHHINHDRQDNRLENLQLMDRREHMRLHKLGVRRPVKPHCKYGHAYEGRNLIVKKKGRLCRICQTAHMKARRKRKQQAFAAFT